MECSPPRGVSFLAARINLCCRILAGAQPLDDLRRLRREIAKRTVHFGPHESRRVRRVIAKVVGETLSDRHTGDAFRRMDEPLSI